MTRRNPIIYVCSDAVGETAEAVAKATIRQFSAEKIRTKRYGHIRKEEEIKHILSEAAATGGIVAYTIVQPELREAMREEAARLGIHTVDILGPMMQAYINAYNDVPKQTPGLRQEMDEEYFRRIEAMEFAVKYDDGKDVRGLLTAQIVLVGVSRTSKTPLSIFLAHKGYKVANLPIVLEVKPPEELYKTENQLIVGLTMDAEHLLKIRTERLKAVGLPYGAKYASLDYIKAELVNAGKIMNGLGCRIIDVTEKSIEETAGIIIGFMTEER
ncbi:pyruvate, water dikinase regulatory protein [Paenibacillus alkalitolerans]|uniref:pyruvate, water dikinase regulatory protein n=1 Tax=Paenibacillus alkalitolerans TaxID=2799335 RepID=UPI0018F77FBB|nr:pyruvate, water dikinase regulatory protein [Paenibacillus alkalitolerans]